MISKYNHLMRRCFRLAKKGYGKVSPNPLVGCVIFDDDFNIISEGYHAKYGENHAERNAILNSKVPLNGMNLIVNLEPCSHYGKTPPCADLIIEKGIKKVIIAMTDPNPIVAGRGIEKLKNAGIEVVLDVLKDEAEKLNKFFIKNIRERKPYLTIKTASTLDGKISTKTGSSKWITDETSRLEVQKLRNIYDAILTTAQTVIKDNPLMTCRIKNGRNPIRIVIDRTLMTSPKSRIYENTAKVIVVTGTNVDENKIKKFPSHVKILKCHEKNGHVDLNEMMKELYKMGVYSILTETGGLFNNALIQEKIADSLILFIAPKILSDKDGINSFYGSNISEIAQCYNLTIESTKLLRNDIIINGCFDKN